MNRTQNTPHKNSRVNWGSNSICVQMPYLQALYHHIAMIRDCDAPYADLAEIIDCIYEKVGVDNAL